MYKAGKNGVKLKPRTPSNVYKVNNYVNLCLKHRNQKVYVGYSCAYDDICSREMNNSNVNLENVLSCSWKQGMLPILLF